MSNYRKMVREEQWWRSVRETVGATGSKYVALDNYFRNLSVDDLINLYFKGSIMKAVSNEHYLLMETFIANHLEPYIHKRNVWFQPLANQPKKSHRKGRKDDYDDESSSSSSSHSSSSSSCSLFSLNWGRMIKDDTKIPKDDNNNNNRDDNFEKDDEMIMPEIDENVSPEQYVCTDDKETKVTSPLTNAVSWNALLTSMDANHIFTSAMQEYISRDTLPKDEHIMLDFKVGSTIRDAFVNLIVVVMRLMEKDSADPQNRPDQTRSLEALDLDLGAIDGLDLLEAEDKSQNIPTSCTSTAETYETSASDQFVSSEWIKNAMSLLKNVQTQTKLCKLAQSNPNKLLSSSCQPPPQPSQPSPPPPPQTKQPEQTTPSLPSLLQPREPQSHQTTTHDSSNFLPPWVKVYTMTSCPNSDYDSADESTIVSNGPISFNMLTHTLNFSNVRSSIVGGNSSTKISIQFVLDKLRYYCSPLHQYMKDVKCINFSTNNGLMDCDMEEIMKIVNDICSKSEHPIIVDLSYNRFDGGINNGIFWEIMNEMLLENPQIKSVSLLNSLYNEQITHEYCQTPEFQLIKDRLELDPTFKKWKSAWTKPPTIATEKSVEPSINSDPDSDNYNIADEISDDGGCDFDIFD